MAATITTAQPGHGPALGLRRRVDDAQLVERLALLVRRNEALDDFASLVAHELKGSLLAAALGDPDGVGRALDLIDELLDAARSEGTDGWAETRRGLDDALRDLPEPPWGIEPDVQSAFPLPQPLLRVVLRNLISNAAAAGASTVMVSSGPEGPSWRLTVEDDGAGFGARSPGRSDGNGIGLALCRRIVERRGGTLELGESSLGGARATITLPGPSR
jgi:signal transduction histidine kinase